MDDCRNYDLLITDLEIHCVWKILHQPLPKSPVTCRKSERVLTNEFKEFDQTPVEVPSEALFLFFIPFVSLVRIRDRMARELDAIRHCA